MARDVEPGPWVVATAGRLTQDSAKDLVGMTFELEHGVTLKVAIPKSAFADMLLPLLGDVL